MGLPIVVTTTVLIRAAAVALVLEQPPPGTPARLEEVRAAAARGDASAQVELGMFYIRGDVVAKDSAQGVAWVRKAAEQGDVMGQYLLGMFYSSDVGVVARDLVQGAEWMRKAAEQGLADAQHLFGIALGEGGRGVPKDVIESLKWLNLAAVRRQEPERQVTVRIRDDLARQMPPAAVAEAQRRAEAWTTAFNRRQATVAAPRPPSAPGAPIRVGGAIRQPAQIKTVEPVYPPVAVSARVQGVVIVEATIGVDGKVTNATIAKSIPLLDAAALDAVRQYEYAPTLLNGVAVRVIMMVTVLFSLQ
jgi:TonB family protein